LLAHIDGEEVNFPLVVGERIAQRVGIEAVDRFVGDDHRMRSLAAFADERREAGAIAAANLDVVAPLGKINAGGDDWLGQRIPFTKSSLAKARDNSLKSFAP
jgi:hypothetical protein